MRRYLPLSFYEIRAFCTELIKAEYTDTKVVQGLGLCYRVFIEGEKFETIDQQCFKTLTEMKERRNKLRADKTGGESVSSPSRKRSSSQSSSYSSSEQERRKKKRRHGEKSRGKSGKPLRRR